MKSRVAIIGLGGTIAMASGQGGLVPALGVGDLAPGLGGMSETHFEFVDLRAVPSANLGWCDIFDLAVTLAELANRGFEGAVVVQGTDTLEETSFAYELVRSTDIPVAFTGAMRAPSQAGADGAANIQAAITAVLRANDSNSVMVVLDNEIHAARYVRKCHTTALDAFRSGGHGPLGRLHEGRIRWHHVVLPRLNRFVLAQPDRMPKVALVPIAFDQPPDLISALPGLGYAGCVVEAMGAGHVPAAIVPPLAALASTFPVALSTRVDDGGVCERTYAYPGSETDLLSAGLIPAGPLNALKARILLTLCLVAEGTQARTAFVEIIAAL